MGGESEVHSVEQMERRARGDREGSVAHLRYNMRE